MVRNTLFLLVVLVMTGAAGAQAQELAPKLGAPIPLVPPKSAPTAPPRSTPDAPPGFQATELGPLDPSWAGALPKNETALSSDMWSGTSRATVRALLSMLGPTESPGLRALARRLLLSGAVAPTGSDPPAGPRLILMRAEALTRLGALTGARSVLDAVPADRQTEAAVRLRIELAFAGNDVTDACGRVAANLAAYQDIWWDQANIACQLLSGARDKAALALDILRDNGAPADPMFDALVDASTNHAVKLDGVLTPLRATLWASSKRPLPEKALANADAATLAAFAGCADEPPANRLAAAERAAALGAWPVEWLAALYLQAVGPELDAATSLSDAASGDSPRGRAALYAIGQKDGDAALRIQALGQFLAGAGRHNLYFVASRLAAPIILTIGPGDVAKSEAPQLIRALIAADRPMAIEPFLPLADPAEIAPLAAIVHAIAGGDTPPDAKVMGEGLAALALRPSERTQSRIGLFLMLAAEFWGAAPAPELAVQMAPPHRAEMPSAAVWLALRQAKDAHRLGETVLSSIVLAGSDRGLNPEPIVLRRALAGLRAAGMESDARTMALEAAIAGGL